MPSARRGLWRRERASIDASSMTVKPACNDKSRRKSSTMLKSRQSTSLGPCAAHASLYCLRPAVEQQRNVLQQQRRICAAA